MCFWEGKARYSIKWKRLSGTNGGCKRICWLTACLIDSSEGGRVGAVNCAVKNGEGRHRRKRRGDEGSTLV